MIRSRQPLPTHSVWTPGRVALTGATHRKATLYENGGLPTNEHLVGDAVLADHHRRAVPSSS